MLKAIEMKKGIYWVGAIDWSMRNFHGYSTRRGSSYNAYLILDEKITLIDTVKAPFVAELVERISSVVDPAIIAGWPAGAARPFTQPDISFMSETVEELNV